MPTDADNNVHPSTSGNGGGNTYDNTNDSGDDNANANDSGNGNGRLVTITHPDVEVTLPVIPYGYRTTKADWEELVQIIEIEYDIPKLSRSEAQQHDYEVFRYHLKQQYASTLDYILISKFGFGAVKVVHDNGTNETNHRWKADPCLENVRTTTLHNTTPILVENDFPYFVEANIVHYVLWKLGDPIAPHEILSARETLESEPLHALEILQWVNPPYLKSIPEIEHVHFLCRLGTSTGGTKERKN